jgi:quinol monooxygenase YgiN
MIAIVWEFHVAPEHRADFEKHYGPDGTWVKLFRQDRAFKGTSLFRDRENPGRYLTTDCWDDLASYEAFRVRCAKDYEQIDVRMECLTSDEKRVGIFEIA